MAEAGFSAGYLDKEIAELAALCAHKTVAAWALDCAERVLPFIAQALPSDDRAQKAIDTGRAWLRGEISMWEARKLAYPAHAAARQAADHPAACTAARAAGQALGAAHVPTHAPYAAVYAAKAVEAAGGDPRAERDWQLAHLRALREKEPT